MLQGFLSSSEVFHLLFPHTCIGCGSDILDPDNFLCLLCINELPHTNYAKHANNPAEKLFWGRVPIKAAMCTFYFTKVSIVQNLIHEFKYKGNRKIGTYLGNMIGSSIQESHRFKDISIIIPLPLHIEKEKRRGFNQAKILCDGISEITGHRVATDHVERIIDTESQTKKKRIQRWENVNKIFRVLYPDRLEGELFLLLYDVITTGSTLEACASEILKVKNTKVSIATLAMASG
jgi:ComF family protein